jgi:hypothetical protein
MYNDHYTSNAAVILYNSKWLSLPRLFKLYAIRHLVAKFHEFHFPQVQLSPSWIFCIALWTFFLIGCHWALLTNFYALVHQLVQNLLSVFDFDDVYCCHLGLSKMALLTLFLLKGSR